MPHPEVQVIARKFTALESVLDERARRLCAAAETQAIGRSRGGLSTKVVAVACDEYAMIAINVAEGQRNDAPPAEPVLAEAAGLLDRIDEVLADKGFDSDAIRGTILEAHDTLPVIPNKSKRTGPWPWDEALAGSLGLFSAPRLAVFHASPPRVSRRLPRRHGTPFLLSTEELATLWHPSAVTVRTPTLAQVESREFEPPVMLPLLKDHPGIANGVELLAGRLRHRRDSTVRRLPVSFSRARYTSIALRQR